MTNEKLNTALYEKKSPSPLSDIFRYWEKKETGCMDDIWQTAQDRAQAEVQKQIKEEQNER